MPIVSLRGVPLHHRFEYFLVLSSYLKGEQGISTPKPDVEVTSPAGSAVAVPATQCDKMLTSRWELFKIISR